jgi:hypothetical protein
MHSSSDKLEFDDDDEDEDVLKAPSHTNSADNRTLPSCLPAYLLALCLWRKKKEEEGDDNGGDDDDDGDNRQIQSSVLFNRSNHLGSSSSSINRTIHHSLFHRVRTSYPYTIIALHRIASRVFHCAVCALLLNILRLGLLLHLYTDVLTVHRKEREGKEVLGARYLLNGGSSSPPPLSSLFYSIDRSTTNSDDEWTWPR